jgi:hypothetical protein
MSIQDTLVTDSTKVLTAVEHGVAWLVGLVYAAKVDITQFEATDPWVVEAFDAAAAMAAKYGIDVPDIEHAGAAILALAKSIMTSAAPAPAPAPTPPPTPPPATP